MGLRLPRNAWMGVAVFGGVLLTVFALSAPDPHAQQLIYDGGSVVCLAVLALGVSLSVGRRSGAWWAFVAGVAGWVAGDVAYFAGVLVASDVLYMIGYALLGSAIVHWMLARGETRERAPRELVDAAIVFLAGFSVLWFFVLDKVVDTGHLTAADLLTTAYPVLDLLLLSLLVRLVFTTGAWPAAYRLLTVGFAVILVVDVIWRALLVHGDYGVGSWINIGYLSAYVLWGIVALHPSATEIEAFNTAREERHSLSARRVRLLGLVALLPAGVLLVRHDVLHSTNDAIVFATVLAGIPLLMLIRLADVLGALDRVARAARAAEADLAAVIAASPIPVCVAGPDGVVRVWNQAAEEISGYTSEEVVGGPAPIAATDEPGRLEQLYRDAFHGRTHRGIELKVLHRSGAPLDVRISTAPLGNVTRGVVALFEDVTEQRRQAEAVTYLATHDALTGLPNRRLFEQELERVVGRGRRGEPATLLMLDLDNFKLVNDTGGHATGDQLLAEFTKAMQTGLRPGDTFARLSGDEFAVILEHLDEEAATAAATRLVDAARDYRLVTGDGVFDVSISLGLYMLEDGETIGRAFRRADEALYEAKARGKNRLQVWTAGGLGKLTPSRSWSPVLKDALQHGRIDAFLQPIVRLSDGSVAFHEALCRLRTAAGEYVPPGAFLEHAERLGLMPAIDRRMLEHAQTLLATDPTLSLFVNFGASSFEDDDLFAHLEDVLRALGPGRLGIEITEHTALRDFARATVRLARIRTLGAWIAIDDFGAGFTSFAQLASVPSDLIKIDGRFAHRIGEAGVEDAVAEAISKIAHAYGKQVVAEGIETEQAAATAAALGIEYGQGYHFGGPTPSGCPRRRMRLRCSGRTRTPEPAGRLCCPRRAGHASPRGVPRRGRPRARGAAQARRA
jgi:diguanylate cyclase (GGDEF)-like protein/PAS domain S-box-containing protein